MLSPLGCSISISFVGSLVLEGSFSAISCEEDWQEENRKKGIKKQAMIEFVFIGVGLT